MFGLFSRPARRPRSARPVRPVTRVRLLMERLEARDTPYAPTLSMTTTMLGDNMLQLSGYVTDESPTTAVVTFSGGVSGSAYPTSSGYYSVNLFSNGGSSITGTARDNEGLYSDPICITNPYAEGGQSLNPQHLPPTITITSVAQRPNRQVYVAGSVSSDNPGGLSVSISGVASGSVTTQTDGSFWTILNASSLGTVSAQTQDRRGYMSNVATGTLSNSAPSISGFGEYVSSGGMTFLQGSVSDEAPYGLTVRLTSGIPQLNNLTISVFSAGNFSLRIDNLIPAGTTGSVTASVTDWWGASATPYTTYIS